MVKTVMVLNIVLLGKATAELNPKMVVLQGNLAKMALS